MCYLEVAFITSLIINLLRYRTINCLLNVTTLESFLQTYYHDSRRLLIGVSGLFWVYIYTQIVPKEIYGKILIFTWEIIVWVKCQIFMTSNPKHHLPQRLLFLVILFPCGCGNSSSACWWIAHIYAIFFTERNFLGNAVFVKLYMHFQKNNCSAKKLWWSF